MWLNACLDACKVKDNVIRKKIYLGNMQVFWNINSALWQRESSGFCQYFGFLSVPGAILKKILYVYVTY